MVQTAATLESSTHGLLRGSDLAAARVLIYRMLSEFLGSMPDAGIIRALRAPGVAAVFLDAGYDLGVSLLPACPDEAAKRLATEYCHLFLGPQGHIPPFESVQRPGEGRALWGSCTQKVRRRMKAWGLEPKRKGMVPDHISVELDFMAHLAMAEKELCASGDEPRLDKCRRAQRVFLDEHLGQWVPILARAVADRAKAPTYRELLRFTVEFLRVDREWLENEELDPVSEAAPADVR